MPRASEEHDYWAWPATAEVRREERTSHPNIDAGISQDAASFSFGGAMLDGPLGVHRHGGAAIHCDGPARARSGAAGSAADIQGGADSGGAASGSAAAAGGG